MGRGHGLIVGVVGEREGVGLPACPEIEGGVNLVEGELAAVSDAGSCVAVEVVKRCDVCDRVRWRIACQEASVRARLPGDRLVDAAGERSMIDADQAGHRSER